MAKGGRERTQVLGADEATEVVSVLCESFFNYPVMRFVLGPEGDYNARLDTLITFFVTARLLREEVLLGVRTSSELTAAALVSVPGGGPDPSALDRIREDTWTQLGEEPRSRYEAYGAATAPFEVVPEHVHLGMIGVRRSAQGQGLGRTVLEAVHGLSVANASSTGVTLTTEVESNVSLYRHFGYEVLGSKQVESAFTTWGMYRRDGEP